MEKRTKIIIGIIIIAIIAFLTYTNLLPLMIVLILHSVGLYESGGSIYISECSEEAMSQLDTINLTKADFKKYPSLKELFSNMDYSQETFLNMVSAGEKEIRKIRGEYSHKSLFWNGSYYCILTTAC